MKTICVYHGRDLDGWCSGAIVKQKYPGAELIGYDYGQSFPWDKVTKEDRVIMVDVSMPMEDMIKLSKSCYSLHWIDHHKSAIDDYEKACANVGQTFLFNTSLKVGVAACELTWEYLFTGIPTPIGVTLLGEYDTWRNQDTQRWQETILPFQYRMRMLAKSAEDFPKYFFDADFEAGVVYDIIAEGKIILEYQKSADARTCRGLSFETVIKDEKGNDLPAICINSGGLNSMAFDSIWDPSRWKLMVTFTFNGNQWNVSLYATDDDVDCSAIAKIHGGGGHFHAAGFKVTGPNPPWFLAGAKRYSSRS